MATVNSTPFSTTPHQPIAGQRVLLLPLDLEVLNTLHAIMQLEPYPFSHIPRSKYDLEGYLNDELECKEQHINVPYSIWDNGQNKLLGITRMRALSCPFTGDPVPFPQTAEISGTLLAPFAQRQGYNTEAKLLMLGRLFDENNTERVWFRTHQHNHRCRAALANLGAVFEGLLKEGKAEFNTAVFSITQTEWPAVRQRLVRKLRQYSLAEAL